MGAVSIADVVPISRALRNHFINMPPQSEHPRNRLLVYRLPQGRLRAENRADLCPTFPDLGAWPHMLSLRPCVCGFVHASLSCLCFSPWARCTPGFCVST